MFELITPCHFGLESVLKKEIAGLGYDIKEVSDGRVTFYGDEEAIARANIFLRTAERVLIKVCEFKAVSFDELFEKTKAADWSRFIPKDGRFWVKKASSVKSKLFSPSDIQRVMKKAIVESLKTAYKTEFLNETGNDYPIRVFINKDTVTASLDSTGDSLHKRGYRKQAGPAPIAENLAAAILMLTPFREGRILVDPFCGSGTFPIEAAMIAANIAPGMNRDFTAQDWTGLIRRKIWYECIDEANDLINNTASADIQGYDIDGEVLKTARQNALLAGVEHMVHFQERAVKDLSHHNKYGFIVTNPPYGERLSEKESLFKTYRELGESMERLDTWSYYIITSYEDCERAVGKKASKNRKIYNGMIRTYLYTYPGPKPAGKS